MIDPALPRMRDWGNRYAYYYCRQKCSDVIAREGTPENSSSTY